MAAFPAGIAGGRLRPVLLAVVCAAFVSALVAACVAIMFLVFVGTENVQRWDVEKMFEASGGRLEMVTDLVSGRSSRGE